MNKLFEYLYLKKEKEIHLKVSEEGLVFSENQKFSYPFPYVLLIINQIIQSAF